MTRELAQLLSASWHPVSSHSPSQAPWRWPVQPPGMATGWARKDLSNDSADLKVSFLGVWQKSKHSVFLVREKQEERITDYKCILAL